MGFYLHRDSIYEYVYLDIIPPKIMIRTTLGESRTKRYPLTLGTDTLSLRLFYGVFYLLFSPLTCVSFLREIPIFTFFLCMISNALLHLKMFRFKVREALGMMSGRESLISGTYTIKIVSCLLTLLLVSFQFATIAKCLAFRQQKNFFEDYADWNYISIRDLMRIIPM